MFHVELSKDTFKDVLQQAIELFKKNDINVELVVQDREYVMYDEERSIITLSHAPLDVHDLLTQYDVVEMRNWFDVRATHRFGPEQV